MKHYLTSKQQALMAILAKRNTDGSAVDLDQILERLSYETTKESLQFSVRALEKRGLAKRLPTESRRGRKRRPVELTVSGLSYMTAGISAAGLSGSFVVSADEEEALKALETEDEKSAVWG